MNKDSSYDCIKKDIRTDSFFTETSVVYDIEPVETEKEKKTNKNATINDNDKEVEEAQVVEVHDNNNYDTKNYDVSVLEEKCIDNGRKKGGDNGEKRSLTPAGGYAHTKESKAKISLANKGNRAWNKGKARTDNEKEKRKKGGDNGEKRSLTPAGGYAHTKESKAKISFANKGNRAWNKGKARTDNEKEKRKKGGDNGEKRGLTPAGGYAHTKESKAKIGLANKGNRAWNKGKARTDNEKEKISASLLARIKKNHDLKLEEMGLTEDEFIQQKYRKRLDREKERKKRKRQEIKEKEKEKGNAILLETMGIKQE